MTHHLSWFNKDRLDKLYHEKYSSDGKLKENANPIAQGSFAAVFGGSSIDDGDDKYVVRVVSAPPGPSEQYSLDKEVKALAAYLKLCDISEQTPVQDQVAYLKRSLQPSGLCNIDAYYIDTTVGAKKVFTLMPLGRPLMDVIEEQLVSANEGSQSKSKDLTQVISWFSQIARALKMMHSKGVFWRDCKVDNIILIGDEANIIDINSGVCTVGYASHEQLVKLPLDSFTDSQKITDALEQLLHDQPDHQTWETQDVFALSIVVMEWLTYGMFTYPYNRDEPAPSYINLLLYELRVYNLLLQELSDIYDVSALKGRLDRKVNYWRDKVQDEIDPTSQTIRDLTLWPLAVTEFRRDKRLFDLWAALAFWDHVDHQFNFIGHWFDWYFDFSEKATSGLKASAPALADGDCAAKPEDGQNAMENWRQRAGNISADVDLIKARLQERNERMEQLEEDHTLRVVKRLTALTQRMDSLNKSLSTFWASAAAGSPAGTPGGIGAGVVPTPDRLLQTPVTVVYADPKALAAAPLPARAGTAAGAGAGAGATPIAAGRLVEVRLRVRTPAGAAGDELRASVRRALGRMAPPPTPATPG